jgi:hypothetical protein
VGVGVLVKLHGAGHGNIAALLEQRPIGEDSLKFPVFSTGIKALEENLWVIIPVSVLTVKERPWWQAGEGRC